MNVIILSVAVMALFVVASKFAKAIEAKVKGVTDTPAAKNKAAEIAVKAAGRAAGTVLDTHAGLPRLVAAIVAPAVMFVGLACVGAFVVPPQNEMYVDNTAWETSARGTMGAVSDAVLVRTVGATVHDGIFYSTATLSGKEYVSLMGTSWCCTGGEGSATIVGSLFVLACLVACAAAGRAAITAVTPTVKKAVEATTATPAPAAG